MRLDLHLHTDRSDGHWSPTELAAEVARRRLVWWAVTDHDSLDACGELAGSAGLVPGLELSCRHGGREIHLVGLGIERSDPALVALLAGIRRWRRLRAENLLDRALTRADRVGAATLEQPATVVVTRSHVARALVQAGLIAHPAQAFPDWLGDDTLEPDDCAGFPELDAGIAAIRSAGGVAILAHPGIYADIQRIEELLAVGCDGLEVRHRGCSPPLSRLLVATARRRGLLMSCGSDFHGPPCRIGDWRLDRTEAAPLLERLGLPQS